MSGVRSKFTHLRFNHFSSLTVVAKPAKAKLYGGPFWVGGALGAVVAGATVYTAMETHLRKEDAKHKLEVYRLNHELIQEQMKAYGNTTVNAEHVRVETKSGVITAGNIKATLQGDEIAGYKTQVQRIKTELFNHKAIGSYAANYGVRPLRGMLLYGPPGTGKTNIARAISKSFNAKVVHINGPELKQEYVGVSERKLRELFAPALNEWKLQGEKSDLHVFIIDELDTLLPRRTSDDNSGSARLGNSMTTQFLTLLDGLSSAKNILVIGTSNRKEDIDEAVLRPGRLELHIEIALPSEEDRLAILQLKTTSLRDNKLLAADVSLQDLAKNTDLFSGAELEFLIRAATQLAIQNNLVLDVETGVVKLKPDIQSSTDLAKVEKAHLEMSLKDMQSNKIKPSQENREHYVRFRN